ncbi:uncharacterized protein ZMO1_ZMO1959 [Zymomonas mobilis subsp. mobilis ZM4 = ATCC 31821]|uniref:Apolipoprotein A1/A4/E n=1 Tax=Zymomonas mobilis subsp. mobilis (strain ATCC 31821 / ZM4 / CP4) TaxID=264203 RepID=Q5NL27_ZYMMO|nr:hypothetical protein [Zymomonas mobilis]AAV90583.1 hypothetical protein ZMO1959 [Zymomonas mobilis subsp. mobilis ZM4 = ATCC 31821]AVZ26760.1 hypothetical protein ZMO2_ZMO1959 [Zymomonas mobilis subsp. mobilis]AVZ28646.1 hypothetical protein ZMO3_ZMO1959 [Zymomonas mobilis subsp. mobilis]AVZ43092.1 uncharacterized protein ZMO1_ZMO1959 [Zymomonas mobilis subsp. mobilis ZM4 = ATCC 31821]UBQ07839.1 hypothetical protein LB319_00555 [Zymomonas mobilis]
MAIGVDGAARLREIYRRQQQLAELAGIEQKKESEAQDKEIAQPETAQISQEASKMAENTLPAIRSKSLLPKIILAVFGIIFAAFIVTAIETDLLSFKNIGQYLSIASGPISIIGIAYLIFRPFSYQESHRFSRMVSAVRKETDALDEIIRQLSAKVENNQKILAAQADQLLKVGEQSSERLADIGMNMRAEAVGLQRHTDRLTEATDKARESLGPLLDSLPEARKESENLTKQLQDSYQSTSEKVDSLLSHLQTLNSLAPKVENATVIAAKNLATEIEHLSHLDTKIDGRLEASAQAVAAFGNKIEHLIAERMQESDRQIVKMADLLDERIRNSRTALDDLAGHLSFNMTARLGEVNEYATRISDKLAEQIQVSQNTLASFYTQMSDNFYQNLQGIEKQTLELSQKVKASIQGSRDDYQAASQNFVLELQNRLQKIQDQSKEIGHVFEQNIDKHRLSFDQLSSKITTDFVQRLEIIQNQTQDIVQYFENHIQKGQKNLADAGENFAKSLTSEFDTVQNNLSSLKDVFEQQQQQMTLTLDHWNDNLNNSLSDQEKMASDHLAKISHHLAKYTEESQPLFDQISSLIDSADSKFNGLQENSVVHLKSLGEDIRHLSEQINETGAILMNSDWGISKLTERARGLSEQITETVQAMDVHMPAALTRIAEQFNENNKAADLLAPKIVTIEAQAANVAEKFDQAGQHLLSQKDKLSELIDDTDRGLDERQNKIREFIEEIQKNYDQYQQSFDQIIESANTQLSGFVQKLGQLSDLIANIQTQNHGLVTKATPVLKSEIENIQKLVTETREEEKALMTSLGADFSKMLQQQVTEALDHTLVEKVKSGLSSIDVVAEKSVESTRKATERLMQQMLTITNITAGIEKRINEAKEEIENHDEGNFTRHVAWLIDALRSKTIDITRLLSSDISDTAWLSYLKGDRGVFSRKAVRLLDNNELRAIQREYEKNTDFREHVNYYIHDFESMLRRVVNSRDGTALSVTLMSSDIGKLYAALSQAIQKYRQ